MRPTTIINVHVLNNRPSEKIIPNLTGLKEETENSTIIVRDFNILLATDRTRQKNISQDIEDSNITIDHIEAMMIYRTLYPATIDHMFYVHKNSPYAWTGNKSH